MNKTLLTLALIFAAPTALATAPTSGYMQVQDTSTTGTDTTGTTGADANDGAAEQAGAAVDQAAQNTTDAVNNAVDPNGDGVVDSNNDGVADTRQFPWGLLGLLGLFGLMGRNKPVPVVHPGTPAAGTTYTSTTTTDRR
ncbi:hypothetical protein DEIPH_ctg051orf0035 [Deinococcus phoenicis]|uniref:Uncharacterized protein n=1 Tax=Deinococcus phoenicis TaxID=1476583 RepID=A0A016QMZ7_9DEIO|nr:hypothetical protein [Deinococcus phoenicis]EYB67124.1 hypothetical protein DEIPH_ctg051orf0035 [Deinococcus phoenicis]